jgi:hypothetical protein
MNIYPALPAAYANYNGVAGGGTLIPAIAGKKIVASFHVITAFNTGMGVNCSWTITGTINGSSTVISSNSSTMEGGTGIHTPIPQNITFDAGTAVTVTATVTGGTTLFIGAAWNYV